MTLLLDYSWTVPTPATIKAAGYSGVMRYLSSDSTKNLSAKERDGLLAAGLSIGLVWEQGKARAGDGIAAGVTDARLAEAQAKALGYPKTAPIFYAVDSGGLTAAMVIPYFNGIKSVATYPVGIYGSLNVVQGVGVPWKWQCSAWSGVDANGVGRVSTQAHLYQRLTKTVAHPISGTDENAVLHPFPMWTTAPATPAATTAAAVLTVAKSQLGYVERPTNITKYWLELDPALQGGYWCAVFVSWVFKHAGCPLPAMDRSYGYMNTHSAINYAKAHGLWDASGHYSPGDIICYEGGLHTGIVVADNGSIITAIEGNTIPDGASGSQSNGGGVYLRHRPHGPFVTGVLKTATLLAASKPTPPVVVKPTRVLLKVDGDFGPATKLRLQQWAGVAQDGVLGYNTWRHIQSRVHVTPTGTPDHNTWVHLQRLIGATQDGDFGPLSVKALQRYLNSH